MPSSLALPQDERKTEASRSTASLKSLHSIFGRFIFSDTIPWRPLSKVTDEGQNGGESEEKELRNGRSGKHNCGLI